MIKFSYRHMISLESFTKSYKDVSNIKWIVDTEHYKELHAINFNGAEAEFTWESGLYSPKWYGGMCPIQAEGNLVDGKAFYYRARNGSWTLDMSTKVSYADYHHWCIDKARVASGKGEPDGAGLHETLAEAFLNLGYKPIQGSHIAVRMDDPKRRN